MRILIIEDEHYAAQRLGTLIGKFLPDAKVVDVIDTVEESVIWFESHVEPNLVFMDIQLADGLSFQIFEQVNLKCPIIFTTAYDEYALDAFKVNSIDYLLKPIEEVAFKAALDQYQNIYHSNTSAINWKHITKDIFSEKTKHKRRFLIKSGNSYTYLNTGDLVLIYSEDGVSFGLNVEGKRFIIDRTLDNIESCLDSINFYRVSRKHIVALEGITKIHPYLNSRLKLELRTTHHEDVIVSREKVKAFKGWIES